MLFNFSHLIVIFSVKFCLVPQKNRRKSSVNKIQIQADHGFRCRLWKSNSLSNSPRPDDWSSLKHNSISHTWSSAFLQNPVLLLSDPHNAFPKIFREKANHQIWINLDSLVEYHWNDICFFHVWSVPNSRNSCSGNRFPTGPDLHNRFRNFVIPGSKSEMWYIGVCLLTQMLWFHQNRTTLIDDWDEKISCDGGACQLPILEFCRFASRTHRVKIVGVESWY